MDNAMRSSATKFLKLLRMPSSFRYGSDDALAVADSLTFNLAAKRARHGRARSFRLFRLRLAVVTLGPFAQDLVTILCFPREVVFHQPLFVVRRHEIERLRDTRNGDDGEVLGEQFHRGRRREPVQELARGLDLLRGLQDAGGFQIPPQTLR